MAQRSSDQEIGFCHFKLGNLPKSPSVEHRMSPCSMARAARCASGTRLAVMFRSTMRPSRISTWRSAGRGIQADGQSSHSFICFQASFIDSGCSKIRGFVTIRKNPSKLDHGKPTGADAFRHRSNQPLAAKCCGKLLTWAYMRRLASSRIT